MSFFTNNTDWKSWRKAAGGILLLMGFLISFGFSENRRAAQKCTELVIEVRDSLGQNFIEDRDLRELIQDKFGAPEGKYLRNINTSLLEKIINNNPYVADAEVFSSVNGKLIIEVEQRRPLIRVINFNEESFYIDGEGRYMPLSDKYTARVPIANGFIFNKESERQVSILSSAEASDSIRYHSAADKVFIVASFISKSEFWSSQIEQVYINAEGEIELIPKVGKHVILLGDAGNLDKKFEKLFQFYTEGLNKTGWNKYSHINLKYTNQIVCTKK